LAEAAADSGLSLAEAEALVPRGGVDMALAYHHLGDAQMVEELAARDLQAIEAELGVPVVIERISAVPRAVASLVRSPADAGSLLLVSEATCISGASADASLQQMLDRLRPVATCVHVPYRLVALAGVQASALASRERCVIASAGYGGRSSHLARAAASRLGSGCREAAFNGGASALGAILGGHVDAALLPLALVSPWLADGSLHVLEEAARPEPAGGWYGLLAGAAWPTDRLDRLAQTLHASLADDAMRAWLEKLGLVPAFEQRDVLAARIARERRAEQPTA
jgi:tripartite-type tricarboxylate transporter receptor subunit TctC